MFMTTSSETQSTLVSRHPADSMWAPSSTLLVAQVAHFEYETALHENPEVLTDEPLNCAF